MTKKESDKVLNIILFILIITFLSISIILNIGCATSLNNNIPYGHMSTNIVNLCSDKNTDLYETNIVRIDNTFSKEYIEIIKDSFKKWEKSLNNIIHFKLKIVKININYESCNWDCDKQITIYNGNNDDFRSGRYRNGVGGATFIEPKDVFIFETEFPKRVILHEIGHIMIGNWHSTNENDIMFHMAENNNNTLTKNDIQKAHSVLTTLYLQTSIY